MISPLHLVRLAFNNLRHGGQRVIVALLCIVFGVMSLVSMTMLSKSIEHTLILQPAEMLGGDLSVSLKDDDYISARRTDQLDELLKNGTISQYTMIAYYSSLMFHTPGSGEMYFGNGYGILPDEYPLAGSLSIGQPGNTSLSTLLQQTGDVIITRDLAEEYALKLGDRIILAEMSVGAPVEGVVRGIAYDTPNHQGSKIYFNLDTAQMISARQDVVNVAVVNASDPGSLAAILDEKGWFVSTAAQYYDSNKQVSDLILICLRGAGILGLLVGGIGIANTMQVLLRRRQREIAIWKTLGYQESDLQLMFSIEAGLLGLTGSLIGAGLGVIISSQLLELFRRTSNLLYEWVFSAMPPVIGVLVGLFTTIIFAYWSILVTGQSKPMALLRNERVEIERISRWKSAGLALLLAIPFTAVTSFVMGSIIGGIGILVFALAGIALLGGFFAGLLWVFIRFLPLRGIPLARMALNNLKRRSVTLVFAMIALFAGVSSMSLGMVFAQNSTREMSMRAINLQGYNLEILCLPDQETAIRKAIEAQSPEDTGVGYRAYLSSLRVAGGEDLQEMDAVLMGRSELYEYEITGAEWGSQPGGVYAGQWTGLQAGSQVEVVFRDGSTHVFRVAGTYDIQYDRGVPMPSNGLLMDLATFQSVAEPETISYFVRVVPDQLEKGASALGAALPQATVINLAAYATRFIQAYKNLFVLAVAMASLALLAGILLVANSVSLAMLDRSHEIGVLKTVGYSRAQVLAIFAVEYGIIGVLATAAGILAVQVLLGVLAIANQVAASLLLLSPEWVILAAACGIGLILLTVIAVTWQPTRISPAAILNERNG